MEFAELETDEEYDEAYPILVELVPRLRRSDFLHSLTANPSQKLFGLRDSGRLVSVAAAWVLETGLAEKLLWIYAFVTTEPMRGRGCGRALAKGLQAAAKKEGFDEIRVHVHRDRAIEFWRNKTEFEYFSNIYRIKLKH